MKEINYNELTTLADNFCEECFEALQSSSSNERPSYIIQKVANFMKLQAHLWDSEEAEEEEEE